MTTFAEELRARISRIETEAKAKGLNWTTICQQAGVSRATPDRWKRKPPKTIEIVNRIESIVAEAPQQAAA